MHEIQRMFWKSSEQNIQILKVFWKSEDWIGYFGLCVYLNGCQTWEIWKWNETLQFKCIVVYKTKALQIEKVLRQIVEFPH